MTQAISREINALRHNGITDRDLFNQLLKIYHQHNMREWLNSNSMPTLAHPVPIIVCSEALM